MDDQICPIVRWHFKLFRLFCFCPISFSRKAKFVRIHELLLLIWSMIVLVVFSLFSYLYYRIHELFVVTDEGFEIFVDSVKNFATVLGVSISTLEPLLQKHNERKFWNHYIRLSSGRQVVKASLWTQVKEYKTFLLKFYGFFLLNQLCIVVIVVNLYHNHYAPLIIIFWSFFIPYTYFLRFKSLQLMFYLDLIAVEIESLDKDLQLLVEYTRFRIERNGKLWEFVHKSILAKQKVYENIFDMVECFKNASGMAIIANYFKCYVRLLTNCGWLYWTWQNSQLTYKDLLLVPAILEIPMFLLTAKSCMNAAKYISYRVHNLKHSPENIAASVQIQNFSLQILHQQIKIDGLGIASMDGYMLTKAVGSITTYMVFFIQFMPKFKSKFD